MEGTMGNEGINKLAGVLQNRIKTVTAKPAILDIGEIGGDMSLTTNQFPQPIPQTDYIVCRQLTLGPKDFLLTKTQDIGKSHSGSHLHNTINASCTEGGSVSGTVGQETGAAPDPPEYPGRPVREKGEDSHDGEHQHHVLIPEKMRSIKPGDRVLVAWVGDDACIIDLILPGTAV